MALEQVAVLLVQTALGLWFLLAAAGQIMGRGSHMRALRAYTYVPQGVAPYLGVGLIALEIGLGFALVVGLWSPWTLAAAAALLAGFGIAVAIDLLRGVVHDCGCGVRERPISWILVVRNVVIAGATAGAFWLRPPAVEPAERLLGVFAVLGVLAVGMAATEMRRALTPRAATNGIRR